MSSLRKGARVRHVSYGAGVIDTKMGFSEWRVRFDLAPALPRTVRGCDLTSAEEPRAMAVGAASPALQDTVLQDTVPAVVVDPPACTSRPVLLTRPAPADSIVACPRAWQSLEALRLGVVPAHGVEEYTVARAAELREIRELLDDRRGCRVIWGDYGAGKTHMLDAAEQLALEQGFATVRITLDPSERALHHPLRLYQKITASLRTAELVSDGFAGILDRLVDSPAHFEPQGGRASRFFSPYLHALRHGRDDQVACLRDYVHGEKVVSAEVNAVLYRLRWKGANVLRMSDFRTYGRMYTLLLGTLATWCADAGTRGLVLLFDEVERLDALEAEDRRRAFAVLRHFAAVTIDRDDLAFDPEKLYRGGHIVHQSLPLRFRADQPLTAIFALTPLDEIEQRFARVTTNPKYDVRLEGLNRHCIAELVRRIAGIYARAYAGYDLDDAVVATVGTRIAAELDDGHDSFRAVVRAAVFLLDADRCGGDGIARPATGTAK